MNLKAYCACKKKCKMWKSLKNYFKNIVHSCIILCVCIAPVEIHNWAKYEGSKLNHVVRRATWRIELKWLPFKKNRLYSLIHVHILGAHVQNMKFLWSNLWTEGLSTDDDNDDTQQTIHDCIGSLAWLPNEPIKYT